MRLVRCSTADIPRLARMRADREQWMAEHGIEQWPIGSLPEPMIRRQVERGEWYRLEAVRHPEQWAAAARLLDEDPEFWGEDVASALYVHALMVDTEHAGAGLGSRLLELAAVEACGRGRAMLRLDCVPHLVPYYRAHGFQQVGTKEFPEFTTILLQRPLARSTALDVDDARSA